MKTKNIKQTFTLFMLNMLLLCACRETKAQDCNGRYQCWVDRAFQALRWQQFAEAAETFKAAQACDDAPPIDTIKHWIDSAYNFNIKFFEKQKRIAIQHEIEAKNRVKNARKQENAYKITSDYINTVHTDDLSLQLLMLHNACRTTNNTNKLTMRTRRDMLSDTNNLFYSHVEPLNTVRSEGIPMEREFLRKGGEIHKFSKDRNKHIIVSENQATIKNNYGQISGEIRFNDKIDVAKSVLSAHGKYLLIFKPSIDSHKTTNTALLQYQLSIFDTENGKAIVFPEKAVLDATFSPSGDSLLILTADRRFILRGVLNDGKMPFTARRKIDSAYNISCLTLTHNGKHIITGSENGAINIWDINGKRLNTFPNAHTGRINTLLVSNDDKRIISGSADNTVIVWTLASNFVSNLVGKKIFATLDYHFEGHKEEIICLAFSPHEDYFISGSKDKTVRIWDTKGNAPQIAQGHNYPVDNVSFSADGHYFYTQDAVSAKTWYFKPNKVPLLMENLEHNNTSEYMPYFYLAAPDKQSVFVKSTHKNGQFQAQWHDRAGNLILPFNQNADKIRFSIFSPNSRFFCIQRYGLDALEIWQRDNKQQHVLKSNGTISHISFSPDSRYILISNKLKDAELFEMDGLKKIKDFKFNSYNFNNVTFSPDSRFVMETLNDSLTIFKLENLEPIIAFKEAFKEAAKEAFKDNGTFIDTILSDAQIMSIEKDTCLIMITNLNNQAEFWRLKPANNQLLFPFTTETVANIKSFDNGNYFYYETQQNTEFQSKIRKTKSVDTIIITFKKRLDDFFLHKTPSGSSRLYVLANAELFEVNLNEPNNNIDLQPTIMFKSSTHNAALKSSFSQGGDSVFIGNLVYPNSLKRLNDNQFIPPSILTIKNKRLAGILTDEDCDTSRMVENMCECVLMYANDALEDTNASAQYEHFVNKINRAVERNNDEDIDDIKYLQGALIQIIDSLSTRFYDQYFPQKIAYTKTIIAIYEKIALQENEDKVEKAKQFSNLSWYILMDTAINKVEKALDYGQKAVDLDPQDWIVANLGHAHLFNNDIEKAKVCYTPLLYRYKAILADFDIFEKAGFVPPKLNEIVKWVKQEGLKN